MNENTETAIITLEALKNELNDAKTLEEARLKVEGFLLVANTAKDIEKPKPETFTVDVPVAIPKPFLEYLLKLAPALGISLEDFLKDTIYSVLCTFFSGGHLDSWLEWVKDNAGDPDKEALEDSIEALRGP